jgi:hypothetical protein
MEFCFWFHNNCEFASTMFIRRCLNNVGKYQIGERSMFEMTTLLLAGLGAASLGAAFLEYRLSRKSKAKAEA